MSKTDKNIKPFGLHAKFQQFKSAKHELYLNVVLLINTMQRKILFYFSVTELIIYNLSCQVAIGSLQVFLPLSAAIVA